MFRWWVINYESSMLTVLNMLYPFALTPVSCLLITMAKFVITLEPGHPMIYRLWNKLWFLLPVRLHVHLPSRYVTIRILNVGRISDMPTGLSIAQAWFWPWFESIRDFIKIIILIRNRAISWKLSVFKLTKVINLNRGLTRLNRSSRGRHRKDS